MSKASTCERRAFIRFRLLFPTIKLKLSEGKEKYNSLNLCQILIDRSLPLFLPLLQRSWVSQFRFWEFGHFFPFTWKIVIDKRIHEVCVWSTYMHNIRFVAHILYQSVCQTTSVSYYIGMLNIMPIIYFLDDGISSDGSMLYCEDFIRCRWRGEKSDSTLIIDHNSEHQM